MAREFKVVAAVGGGFTVCPVVMRDGVEGIGFACVASVPTEVEAERWVEALRRSYDGRLFTPAFPVLFNAEGERCHRFGSGDRRPTQCVRRAGHDGQRHLMDVMNRDAKPGSRTAQCGCGTGTVDLIHRQFNAEHIHTAAHTQWVVDGQS